METVYDQKLLDILPQYAVGQGEPHELLEELRKVTALSVEQQRSLDFILRQWTMRALSRQDDLEGLLEMHDLLRAAKRTIAKDCNRNHDEFSGFMIAWQAYEDLLELKRLGMGRSHAPEHVMDELSLSRPILARTASGNLTRQSLVQEFSSNANAEDGNRFPIKRVIAVMEEAGLITQTRKGGQTIITLGPNAPAPEPAGKA